MEVRAPQGQLRLDGIRLRQALDGLLDNALGHTAPGGSIVLWGERSAGLVRLGVQDTGCGFRPEFLPHAFEPFSRHAAGGRDGAGLGLAIVRAIAEAHGGSVQAGNRAEGGASVTIDIPDPGSN